MPEVNDGLAWLVFQNPDEIDLLQPALDVGWDMLVRDRQTELSLCSRLIRLIAACACRAYSADMLPKELRRRRPPSDLRRCEVLFAVLCRSQKHV